MKINKLANVISFLSSIREIKRKINNNLNELINKPIKRINKSEPVEIIFHRDRGKEMEVEKKKKTHPKKHSKNDKFHCIKRNHILMIKNT